MFSGSKDLLDVQYELYIVTGDTKTFKALSNLNPYDDITVKEKRKCWTRSQAYNTEATCTSTLENCLSFAGTSFSDAAPPGATRLNLKLRVVKVKKCRLTSLLNHNRHKSEGECIRCTSGDDWQCAPVGVEE
ncbi:unnamed protein product [Trichogramma brassicae]|uniref:Uncharacterized protein n=1 Tax=Trichogramma brassicae TaxID=86971 RepID=A0A6H5IFA2_9HYME|nr:unnamed protein product [Trichogramma brassicae]